MVKRHPHIALITITSGSWIDGEWVKGEKSEIKIKGLYFSSSNDRQMKQNVDGNASIVHGEFSTKVKPVKDATHIRIDSIGLDAPIICWEPFQTHSVIYV